VRMAMRFPAAVHTIVVGAGTAGAVVAGRLAAGSAERTLLLEAAPELRRLLGRETRPGPQVSGRRAIERFIDDAAVHCYHPAGSCKMGPASDPDSVADSEGRVPGVDGLYVADASLMPAVTSGNTNMPATVIGERIARSLLGLPQTPAWTRPFG
jgi:choline dehydrogenase